MSDRIDLLGGQTTTDRITSLLRERGWALATLAEEAAPSSLS